VRKDAASSPEVTARSWRRGSTGNAGSADGHLYAFELDNGTRIWDWRAPGDRPAESAPGLGVLAEEAAQEKADLVAYLRSLSSDDGRVTPPILPR